MIFKTSPRAVANDQNESVAMPENQTVASNENQMQDDQELAKVLADINNQVSANSDNLMADLEQAMTNEKASGRSSNDMSEAAFEKIEEEADAEAMSAMTDFQPADMPVVNEQSAEVESAEAETTQAPVIDLNQELKAMNQQISDSVADTENVPAVETPAEPTTPEEVAPATMSDMEQAASAEPVAATSEPEPMTAPVNSGFSMEMPTANDLDELRKKALTDLRPIVDKVELNDEESFDVLLLLIRETDDESLLPRAYEAARQIQDEARRAQALLDVIKEADYFKHKA